MSTYNKIEKELTSKEKFHICLGLERTQKVLELFANPQDGFASIHIAGTNGKGSTASMLAKMLEASGYKTGLFTSPHLLKYNERIKINSVDISDSELQELLVMIEPLAKEHALTEFEVLTVAAFLYFKQEQVDIAIIEVGLGGRLDSTNVITPLLSVITSIGLDHTQRLGATIEKVAYEKAGIIKANSKVIANADNKGLKVISDMANSVDAQLILADEVQGCELDSGYNLIRINNQPYRLSLLGAHQAQNLALALKAKDELEKKGFVFYCVEDALKNIRWGARFQLLRENVVLDGAHNPDAAIALRGSLDKYFPNKKRTWFFSSLNNKDYKKVANILFRKEDKVYFVEFEHHSALAFDEFRKNISLDVTLVQMKSFVANFNEAKNTDDLTIIAGSLYLAGDILALLGNN